MAKMKYDFQTEVVSFTNLKKSYKVSYLAAGNRWLCSCPAWIFRKNRPSDFRCKHITAAIYDVGVNPLNREYLKRPVALLPFQNNPTFSAVRIPVEGEIFLVKRQVRMYEEGL